MQLSKRKGCSDQVYDKLMNLYKEIYRLLGDNKFDVAIDYSIYYAYYGLIAASNSDKNNLLHSDIKEWKERPKIALSLLFKFYESI